MLQLQYGSIHVENFPFFIQTRMLVHRVKYFTKKKLMLYFIVNPFIPYKALDTPLFQSSSTANGCNTASASMYR